MIIMGLDVSSTSTGVAVVDLRPSGEICNVYSDIITTSSKMKVGKRLSIYINTLFGLLEEYKPDLVVKEGSFSNGRVHATQMLFRWNGATEYAVFEYGIDHIYEYQPTTIKKMLTDNGRASKEAVAEAIDPYIYIENFDELIDDQTDAYATILTHIMKTSKAIKRSTIAEIESDVAFLEARGELPKLDKIDTNL